MCGFVYIWYDKKHQMFYVGSHKGHIHDRYIASSKWMRAAYHKRTDDFKRKIIYIGENYREIEQKLLDTIKISELGTRYYNLKTTATGGNGGACKRTKRTPISKKRMSESKLNSSYKSFFTEEAREKSRLSKIGKSRSPSTKEKLRAAFLGKKRGSYKQRKPNINCENCSVSFIRPRPSSRFCSNHCSQMGRIIA